MSERGQDNDKAGIEAAQWLLALEEEPDDTALRDRFEAWLAGSPANRAAWASTAEVDDMIGSAEYAGHRSRRESQKVEATHLFSRLRTTRRRAGLTLATAAIAACIAWFVLPGIVLRLQADHLTATAETRSLSLEDGSTVALAPESAIEVMQGPGRTVRLLKGEALFQVTRNPDRPFRVLANGVETTVLGTEFDVRLLDNGAFVMVREGMVRVDRSGGAAVSERLQAGDWLSVAAAARVERGAVPPAEVAAWQGARIIARDRSIADVAQEIGRSFPGVIVMPSESFGRQRITGVYNLSDPVAALRAAAAVHGGTVRQVSPWLLIVTGG